MSIVIQKFGGTSLKSPLGLKFLLSHVEKTIALNKDLVIVVSAIGRSGDPYATDTLINRLERIGSPIDPKKKDLIMSCGEIISASIVAHLLDTNGIPSEALTGPQAGIRTNEEFNSSEILNIDTSNIKGYLKEGKVVVVAGFQGENLKGEITTLGRGGSDITAVALGGYLNAEEVHIFTDVPGVAVIDPKILPSTKYLDTISYEDMYLLASNGAKVIHYKAVSMAKKYGLPIYIRSTFQEEKGSLIGGNRDETMQKIIGITLDKLKDMGKVSLFFNDSYKIHLVPHINNFISKNPTDLFHTKNTSNGVDFFVKYDKIEEFAKDLYYYFFKE